MSIFLNFWSSKPWIRIRITIHLKCWIRIRIPLIQIKNTAASSKLKWTKVGILCRKQVLEDEKEEKPFNLICSFT
jgi:hypothetical protein